MSFSIVSLDHGVPPPTNWAGLHGLRRIVVASGSSPAHAFNAGARAAWQSSRPAYFLFLASAWEFRAAAVFADALARQPDADYLVNPTAPEEFPFLVRSGLFLYLRGLDPGIEAAAAVHNLFVRYNFVGARCGAYDGSGLHRCEPTTATASLPRSAEEMRVDLYGRSWRRDRGSAEVRLIEHPDEGPEPAHIENSAAASQCAAARAHAAAGDDAGAAAAYRRLIFQTPDEFVHLPAFAAALADLGQYDEAEHAVFLALQFQPNDDALWNQYGNALQGAGVLDGAVAAYDRALVLRPDFADAAYSRGCAESAQKEYVAAVDSLRLATASAPDHARAFHNLGTACFELGRVDAALDAFRAAERLAPNDATRLAVATILPGVPRADHSAILAARRAVAAHLPRSSAPRPRLMGPLDRPLRIGYLSHFFHRANWMKPVWALINHHDRAAFQIHLFGDVPDFGETTGYRGHDGDTCHDVRSLDNPALAGLIRDSGIDVLVDLNGYSYGPRLPLFAAPVAPVVVGWFNYYATAALPGVDCLIGDEQVMLSGEEPFYAEPVIAAPGCYLTFEVGYPVPAVTPPPCRTGRGLTFGALASQHKINAHVVAAWSRILSEVPTARLLLRSPPLSSARTRAWMTERFAAHGVGADRLILLGPADHAAFLETYGQIDVALDPFPYNGGTTTTEALWQGVPVLSWVGDRWASRTSASLLVNAGLAQFLAADIDGYVRAAIALANDPNTPEVLTALRSAMRDRLRAAPVCDAVGFARNMEAIYRRLCAERFVQQG